MSKNTSDKKTYAVEELQRETIDELSKSQMDARHNHLNKLLDDEGLAKPQ